MKYYYYERGDYGTHTVKITLQSEKYKAEIYTRIGGNIGGADVIRSIAADLEDNFIEFEVTEENKKYLLFEDGAEDGKFSHAKQVMLFKGDASIDFDISENSDGLSHVVTGIEIVNYE